MFIQFQKADENGKSVRAVKLLDYSGSCERSFDLPLREAVLWKTARYADLHGEFPDGEFRFPKGTIERNGAPSGEATIAQAVVERVRLACGKCHWCANQRKRRWERAATGWVEHAPLTLFGTLTFSDEYFSREFNQWIDAELEKDFQSNYSFEELVHMRTDRFDPANGEHDSFMRQQLCAERIKLMKRLRDTLGRAAEAEPTMAPRLLAHLAVYEYGDLRGRLHMHFLMHFELDELPIGAAFTQLRKFLKKHWHERGIGFVDVQHATPETGAESAKYLCQYLLAYQEVHNQKRVTKSQSRLACSNGYRAKGTEFYFGARPSLVPGGSLRPVDPIPAEVREGFPVTSAGDVDREDLYLSEASKKLTLEEMPHDFRVLAEQLAQARLAHNTGELWPGWAAGLERPEDDWAEVPDGDWNFAAWILARYWKKNDTFQKEIRPGRVRNPADGSVYSLFTGEIIDET